MEKLCAGGQDSASYPAADIVSAPSLARPTPTSSLFSLLGTSSPSSPSSLLGPAAADKIGQVAQSCHYDEPITPLSQAADSTDPAASGLLSLPTKLLRFLLPSEGGQAPAIR